MRERLLAQGIDEQKLRVVSNWADGRHTDALNAAAKERLLQNVIFEPYQPRSRLALSLGVADVHLVILRPDLEGMIVPSKCYGIAAAGGPA